MHTALQNSTCGALAVSPLGASHTAASSWLYALYPVLQNRARDWLLLKAELDGHLHSCSGEGQSKVKQTSRRSCTYDKLPSGCQRFQAICDAFR